eukprot:scaffold6807_cov139-Isochrysis_galbana.AAC.6
MMRGAAGGKQCVVRRLSPLFIDPPHYKSSHPGIQPGSLAGLQERGGSGGRGEGRPDKQAHRHRTLASHMQPGRCG